MAENTAMHGQESVPYNWLKSVDPTVYEKEKAHPLGSLPPFPADAFQRAFKEGLDIDPLSLTLKGTRWCSEEEFVFDLGAKPFSQEVRFNGVSGAVWLLIPKSALETLVLLLAGNAEASGTELFDEEILKGFERFLLLKGLKAFKESGYLPSPPVLAEEGTLPTEPSLAIDLLLCARERDIPLRLLLSDQFVRFLKESTAERTLSTSLSADSLSKLRATLHLELGKLRLQKTTLQEIEVGDVLFLDLCSYDPESKEGFLTLTLNGTPKAKAKLEGNRLVIGEGPSFDESTLQLKRRYLP